MTHPSSFKASSTALPILALLVAVASFQMGAALAKQLFPRVGVAGTTALRLGIAALILTAVWRSWRLRPSPRDLRTILVYGLALGFMNLFFYLALSRIPLGIAVALEFTGPLAVAIANSRRLIDFLWIAAAVLGLILLLPLGMQINSGALAGVGFALVAGACWALYIVFGKRAGSLHGAQAAALGITTAAIFIVPIGISQAGLAVFSPAILPLGFGLALLSSALPYSLEMYALARLPTRTYGVMASTSPALGALSGLIFLGEALNTVQWIAIGCIVLASAGSAATSRERPSPLALADQCDGDVHKERSDYRHGGG